MQRSYRLCAAVILRLWLAPVVLGVPTAALAGGYLAVDTTGQPYKWAGPVPYHLDLGPLGKLSNEEADALVVSAMSHWTPPAIPGSAVEFAQGADLQVDNGVDAFTFPDFDAKSTVTDGITAILYDQHGHMVEQLGAGQSEAVVGFAGPVVPNDYSPAPLTEGLAVFNGKFYDGDVGVLLPNDLPLDQYKAMMTHELGHMLNLDHAQAAIAFSETGFDAGSLGGYYTPRYPPDYRGVPTMFPFVLAEMDTLETDDIAWILDLYPNAQAADNGSISGTIRNFDGTPVNGMNVVAYSADDPTSLITCVSGYTDGDPVGAPTGIYKMPSLPPGSKWILDVEPIVEVFVSGSSVGPLDPPAAMPGPPEYLNETGVESAEDSAAITTTFEIPLADGNRDVADVNLTFSDINDPDSSDIVSEVDTGVDLDTAQIVPVTPGRYTFINGTADPNEPGITDLQLYGTFGDYYRVKSPAGLELNQVFISSQGSTLDVLVAEKRLVDENNPGLGYEHRLVASTAAFFGINTASLFLDSSRMSVGPDSGTYYFAVGFVIDPKVVSDYTLGLLFTVSDRDPLVVKGAEAASINPDAGSVRILGRGFKNLGGAPSVEFDTPGIQVDGVTFVDENTLDVDISKSPGFTPGETTVQVTNQPLSGGYGGRIIQTTTGEASAVADWELY